MKSSRPDQHLVGGFTGAAFLLGNVLCWSAVPVLLRHLTRSLDAWTANGFRYPLSAILFWPVLAAAWKSGKLDRSTIKRCLVPSILAFGGQVFWALAPYHLPASAIGFLMRFALVFALIGAMLLFRDERKLLSLPHFYAGLALTVGGFLVLSASKVRFDAEVGGTGIAIMLLCSVFFGFYGVSVRYFLRGISPIISFGVVCQFVSLGTLVAMFSIGNYSDLVRLAPRDWGLLVGSSILGIALGHHFLYSAVARLGAAITSGAQTLAPFLTLALAAWFLGETMLPLEWGAGLTMVAGAVALLFAQNKLVAKSRREARAA